MWLLPPQLLPLALAQKDSPQAPVVVLENVLAAACSQDAKAFSAHLTGRNLEAFGRMTRAAQSTLLKRFVLVDSAGKPRAEAGESGTLDVFCVTPNVATQLHIGQVEIRDNLAYLPLSVKDVSDSSDAGIRRVTMGLVREGGQWKLLSLGVLLLDLPTLGEEWDRAEMQNNERAALASMKLLIDAIEKYRVAYTHLPETLGVLGSPPSGASRGDHAGFVEAALADGRKDGYVFRYVIVGANESGAPAKYELAAVPAEYGRTGARSFLCDPGGKLHAADHHGGVGNDLDPKAE